MNGNHNYRNSVDQGIGGDHHRLHHYFASLRSGSQRSTTPTPSVSKNSSQRSTTPTPSTFGKINSRRSTTPTPTPSTFAKINSRRSATPTPSSLNRNISRGSPDSRGSSRRSTTPILFSNSSGRLIKQPLVEKKLECSLEELCFGATKKVKITRDVIEETGDITQEEEILTINITPGWKTGTKVTFEEKGNKRPGVLPGDIMFIIEEKQHQVFRREGNDLELVVEIPLVQALTGCTLQIPLLGGQETSLEIEDIVEPGSVKIVPGEGMPNTKDQGKRGNLRLVFLVEFPTELTEQQRNNVLRILEGSS